MRQCVSCGDPIDSRRKDSKFCPKAKCRAKEYRRRQAAAAAAPAHRHDHQMSAVFACPCGRKFLLQVTSLEDQPSDALPTVTFIDIPSTPVTQTVLPHEQPPNKDAPAALEPSEPVTQTVLAREHLFQEDAPRATPPPLAGPQNSSEQFAQGLQRASTCTEVAAPVVAAPAIVPIPVPVVPVADTAPAPSPPTRLQLHTFELYFTNQNGRAVPFWSVVRKYGSNSWRVASYARAALGFGPGEGTGLGGVPGRWHDIFPLRDPSEFGHDADLAVLCWDEQDRKVYPAEVELLQAAFGSEWKAILRQERDRRAGIRIR